MRSARQRRLGVERRRPAHNRPWADLDHSLSRVLQQLELVVDLVLRRFQGPGSVHLPAEGGSPRSGARSRSNPPKARSLKRPALVRSQALKDLHSAAPRPLAHSRPLRRHHRRIAKPVVLLEILDLVLTALCLVLPSSKIKPQPRRKINQRNPAGPFLLGPPLETSLMTQTQRTRQLHRPRRAHLLQQSLLPRLPHSLAKTRPHRCPACSVRRDRKSHKSPLRLLRRLRRSPNLLPLKPRKALPPNNNTALQFSQLNQAYPNQLSR